MGYNNYEATLGIPEICRQKFTDLGKNGTGERRDVRDGPSFVSSPAGSVGLPFQRRTPGNNQLLEIYKKLEVVDVDFKS